MSKSMRLDEEQFRAVILYRYPGLSYPIPTSAGPTYKQRELPAPEVYWNESGQPHEYHRIEIAGPYSATGQARAQITRAKKDQKRSYGTEEYITAFIEVAETVWKKII